MEMVIFFYKDAMLKFLPLRVFLSKDSMANVLSLKDVVNLKGAYVHMDLSKAKNIELIQMMKEIHNWRQVLKSVINFQV